MNSFYPTHILYNLIRRKLKDDKLTWIVQEDLGLIKTFLDGVWSNGKLEADIIVLKQIQRLLEYGLISDIDRSQEKEFCSLLFVEAVNFELTYKCQYNCPHCWQSGKGKNGVSELSTFKVKDTIFRAFIAGLCQEGINFTGGEVIGNRDDLFEILEYTNSLKIPYRINTNSWWTQIERLKIGNKSFSSPFDLVMYLKSIGLKLFAFSFDERYKENQQDIANLIESINLCERAGVNYQVIFTGVQDKNIKTLIVDLHRICNVPLKHFIPVSMELVDIGSASDLDNGVFKWQSNKCWCNKKGFFRPEFLHISPEGNVRTCLYANGLANVGSLKNQSLTELVNSFPYNKQNYSFSSDEVYEDHFNELVRPYLYVYRPIVHECTSHIILAKALERKSTSKESSLLETHKAIAREMNLLHQ